MKARLKIKNVELKDGTCLIEEFLEIRMPCILGINTIPLTRDKNNNDPFKWYWNRSVDSPTLIGSVLTCKVIDGKSINCHFILKDGVVTFLSETNCGNIGDSLELLDIEDTPTEVNRVYNTSKHINGKVTIYDDKKEKHNSVEARYLLGLAHRYSGVEISLTGYGSTEEEAIDELRSDYNELVKLLSKELSNGSHI